MIDCNNLYRTKTNYKFLQKKNVHRSQNRLLYHRKNKMNKYRIKNSKLCKIQIMENLEYVIVQANNYKKEEMENSI